MDQWKDKLERKLEDARASWQFRVLGAILGVFTIIEAVDLAISGDSEAVRRAATAYLTLVVVAVFLYALSRFLRRASDEGAYQRYAERYGMAYDELQLECTIDPQGSAVIERKVLVTAYSEISQLETALVVPEKAPEGAQWEFDLPQAKSLDADREVVLEKVERGDGKISGRLLIAPKLIARDQFGYKMEERLANLFAIGLTEDQLAGRRNPNEYFGWTINRPTRKLSMTIYFPDDFRPRLCDVAVKHASVAPGLPSETYQNEEQKRLGMPHLVKQGKRFALKLDVDYPMVGLVYILSWRPQPATP